MIKKINKIIKNIPCPLKCKLMKSCKNLKFRGIHLKTVFIIAKKEFLSFINSPLAYIVTVPFIAVSAFLYFRIALVTQEASLRPLFELLPWLLLFLMPALSMRLLTEEKEQGTIEILFSHPISETEIILGKFFGAIGFYILVLLATCGMPITLIIFSNPDLGVILGQYLGVFLAGAAFLAMGITASTYVKKQTAGFLLGIFINFLFIISGLELVTVVLPWPFDFIIRQTAVIPHINNFARGVIDLRDVVYFITLTIFFLAFAVTKLSARKTAEDKKAKFRLKFVLVITLVLGLGLNFLMYRHPWQFDLTSQKLYSLSKGTKQTIKNLPETVQITLYTSKELPAPIQPQLQQIEDILRDYQRYGNKLKIETKYPQQNSEALKEAQTNGIQEITFNRMGGGKFEAQTGYLGLTISFEDETEAIPFIQNTINLEYSITKKIRKLTSDTDKKILVASLGSPTQSQILNENLRTEYQVQSFTFEEEKEIPENSALIVFDNGIGEQATASAQLKQYLKNGGKALIFENSLRVNQQVLTTEENKSKIKDILKDYGITVNQDLVYDLQLNETISMGQGTVRYFLPYPFWIKALVVQENNDFLNSSIQSVSLAWPSSLTLEEKEGIKKYTILQTSPNAGKQEQDFNLLPQETKQLKPGGKAVIVGAAAEAEKEDAKLAVITSTSLAEDQFIQNNSANLGLTINLVDWLAVDGDLSAIPHKGGANNPFRFTDPKQPVLVQYGNMVIPSLIIIALAVFWLKKRKKLTKRRYSSD